MGDSNDDTINFYSTQGQYGCFSNFSRHPIHLKGKKWPTSEHYFQAMKFVGTPFEEQVRATESPGAAAKIGRNKNNPLRKDWERVKEGVMREALVAKFTQHENLKQTLLSTKGKHLVEHTENDSYWGDGGGYGKNRLGFLLVDVREELLSNESTTQTTTPSDSTPSDPTPSAPTPTAPTPTAPTPTAPTPTAPTPSAPTSSSPTTTSSSGSSDENDEVDEEGKDEGDSEQVPEIEGVEPNHNRLYEAGPSAEGRRGAAPARKKGGRKSGGGGKSRTKRSVFRDADGNSTLEKTTQKKGTVTVIGDGTVFSEKALPPAAKFVVNKHQMTRKYHPTEKDFPDLDDQPDEESKPAPKKISMSEFVKPKIVFRDPAVNGEFYGTSVEIAVEDMTVEQCIDAAKNNLELLSQNDLDADIKAQLKETVAKLMNCMNRFIEESAESNNEEQLQKIMEQYELLQAVC